MIRQDPADPAAFGNRFTAIEARVQELERVNRRQVSMSINDLSDTNMSVVTDGQALSWNRAAGQYTPVYLPRSDQLSCVVRKSTATTVNDVTATVIAWNTAVDNPAGMWSSGTPGRITVPVAGVYVVFTTIEWNAAGLGSRLVRFDKSGGDIIAHDRRTGTAAYQIGLCLSRAVRLAANDYLEVTVYQDSGGAQTVSGAGSDNYQCVFGVHWLKS